MYKQYTNMYTSHMAKHGNKIESLLESIKDLKDYYNITTLDPDQIRKIDAERTKCESSFYEFVKAAWVHMEGSVIEYSDNWHIKALCDHLQATYTMDIMKLIINLPPRCSKSSILSSAFVPWIWTKDPQLTFMYVSHSEDIVLRDSRKARDLINSQWYRDMWGHKVSLRKDANTLKRFYNTAGGFRMSTSVGSNITGEGAWFKIFDDYNDKDTMFSALARTRSNLEFDGGYSTRDAHPKYTRTIISQQRFHELDLTGYVLSKENNAIWTHLCLPMQYVAKRKCITVPLPGTNGKPWQDPRRKENELLWPSFWGQRQVDEKKAELKSAYNISSQFQQSPRSDEGNVLKREWWRIWKHEEMPICQYVLQSWDTAISSGQHSAYSACTVWGIFDHPETDIPHIILLNAWRGKLDYPDLRRVAKCLAFNYMYNPATPDREMRPDLVLIEARATGSPLIADLCAAGILAVPFDPVKETKFIKRSNMGYNTAKEMRAAMASSLIEAGRVWLPARAPNYTDLRKFADEFLEAACLFPAGDGADYVDSMSQALIRIAQSQLIWHPDDEAPPPAMQLWERELREPLY